MSKEINNFLEQKMSRRTLLRETGKNALKATAVVFAADLLLQPGNAEAATTKSIFKTESDAVKGPDREVIPFGTTAAVDLTPTVREAPTKELINGQVKLAPYLYAATYKAVDEQGFDPKNSVTPDNPTGHYTDRLFSLSAWDTDPKRNFSIINSYRTTTAKQCSANTNGEKEIVLPWNLTDSYIFPENCGADYEFFVHVDKKGGVKSGGFRLKPKV